MEEKRRSGTDVGNGGDSASELGEDDGEYETHILDIQAEIQRLHKITSRIVIDRKEDLIEGHLERARYHQQRQQRSTSREGSVVQQGGGGVNASNCSLNRVSFIFGFLIILTICVGTPLVNKLFMYLLGMRCFVPNNYLVWEATRPKSDCSFCVGYDGPIILPNMTREEFEVSGRRRCVLSLSSKLLIIRYLLPSPVCSCHNGYIYSLPTMSELNKFNLIRVATLNGKLFRINVLLTTPCISWVR